MHLHQPSRIAAILSSNVKGTYGVQIFKATGVCVSLFISEHSSNSAPENAPLKAPTQVVLETTHPSRGEAGAEKALDAGSYMVIPFAEKGREAAFDLTLLANTCAMDADPAGFDLIKLSKERHKTPLDKVFTTPFADIQLVERIGQGQLGTVYRGTLSGKQEVAVKRFPLLDNNDKEYFKKEIGILRCVVVVYCTDRILIRSQACQACERSNL